MSFLYSDSEIEEIKKKAVADYLIEHNDILKNRWIPCSERLPENVEDDSVQYLITVKVGEDEYEIDFGWWYKISKYDNNKKQWVDYFGWTVGNDWDEGQGMEVIAWQPLPELYKP